MNAISGAVRRDVPRVFWAVLAGIALACGCDRMRTPAADAAAGAAPDVTVAGVQGAADANLFRAVERGDAGAATAQIESGANVDAANNLERTPLFAAAFYRQTAAAKALLAKGAGLGVRDADGFTPLHAAVLGGGADLAGVLIAAGADVNARSATGMTPLHLAAATGQPELVRLLIAAGADKSIRDKQGDTAAKLAENNRHAITLALLQNGKARAAK